MPKIAKCPAPGCEEILALRFVVEAGMSTTGGWKRKPEAVLRRFVGTCPDHGEQIVVLDGHHVNSQGIQFDAPELWRQVALSAMMHAAPPQAAPGLRALVELAKRRP